MSNYTSHSHETLPSFEQASDVPKTGVASEVGAPKNHTRGKVSAALAGAVIGVSSLFHASPVDAAKKQTDAQILAGSGTEKKEEDAAVAALKFPKFTTLQSLKGAINKGKMTAVKDSPLYTLRGIGEMDSKNAHVYASLRPHTKKLLDNIATKFYVKFKQKLTISSLTRTEGYVDILRKTNKNASKSSTHMYGTTFDFTKTGMNPAQLVWMRALLAEMERSGKIVATEEWAQPCFHIVDIRANEK